MEKISRNNYEVFFLDYMEGNLSPMKKEELFSFLSLHPDLKSELDEYEFITLYDNKEQFENKSTLKKFNFVDEINDLNFEQFCIAFIESDLNEQQKINFNNYIIAKPGKERILVQYKRTRIKTDSSIVYFGKDKLKKGSSNRLTILKRFAVAASLLLVAGLSFFFIIGEDAENVNLISENRNSTEEVTILPQKSFTVEKHDNNVAVASVKNKNIVNSKLVLYSESTEENVELDRVYLKPVQNRMPDLTKPTGGVVSFASMTETEINHFEDSSPRDLLAGLRRNIDEFGSSIDTEGIDGSGRLTIWDIADAGINGFSKLTGARMKIDKKRDKDGNVTALAFQSKNLNFTKRINY